MQGAASLIRTGFKQSLVKSRSFERHKPLAFALQKQKWMSEKPASNYVEQYNGKEKEKASQMVVYEGHMSDALRGVKLLSFTTCCFTALGSPIVTFFMYPQVSVLAKGAIAASMICLSASTTLGLHWFAGPYVHTLTWERGSKEFQVKMLSWIGTHFNRTIRIADVTVPETQRPLVTFAAKDKFYYVDPDNFPNAELLQKIIPGSYR